jgi:hypothetical protein
MCSTFSSLYSDAWTFSSARAPAFNIMSFGKFSTCVDDRCRWAANGLEYIYVYIYTYTYGGSLRHLCVL